MWTNEENMSFADALHDMSNTKKTENGAVAYASLDSAVLDLYAVCGSMRKRPENDILNKFKAAYSENSDLAERMALYVRNIREAGLGERRAGNIMLKYLLKVNPKLILTNLDTIVSNGRWDDLYGLIDNGTADVIFDFMKKQFDQDLTDMDAGRPVSQLAKWLKSVNTSSRQSRMLGMKTAKAFGLSNKEYRKNVAKLRSYLQVIEVKKCSGNWSEINYEQVPSVCMNRSANQFKKHDAERFEQYMQSLSKGEAKVNASVLFPYEIISKYRTDGWGYSYGKSADLQLYEEQWKALPEYFSKEFKVVTVADTSGSMAGTPRDTALGMAIYCAQHNQGEYHNMFITFSNKPQFVSIKEGESLENILRGIHEINASTNFEGMLAEVYRMAVAVHDVPDAMVIVSDNEINKFQSDFNCYGQGIISKWAPKFEAAGLKMPVIVFWNANALHDTFLDTTRNPYVRFISGQAATNFTQLETLIKTNAYDAMVTKLMQYNWKK